MSAAAATPGLTFVSVPRPLPASPLRSDVAGFAGRTRRGPIGAAVRVEGYREYLRLFGGLDEEALTPYAIAGYFENGGEIAYVLRIANAEASLVARAAWTVAALAPGDVWPDTAPAAGGFTHASYDVVAVDPGAWANGTRVAIEYRRDNLGGRAELDVRVRVPDEPTEVLRAIDPARAVEQVAERSRFIRLSGRGPEPGVPASGLPRGPRRVVFDEVTLSDGLTVHGDALAYQRAVQALHDEAEVSLECWSDVYADLGAGSGVAQPEVTALYDLALRGAHALRDRLVLFDAPLFAQQHAEVDAWLEATFSASVRQDALYSAGALYHPALFVADPLGGAANPLRLVPASGHVAGLISRLDRELGAQHTPANQRLLAADTGTHLDRQSQALLYARGINPLRCMPGKGIVVWGGRTLSLDSATRFVAHRRLIHRLVRAIRRVAEPLVFETNGPELWLAFVRAITGVLLTAYRAGGLKGETPDQAFRVRCDETTNPPEAIDNGRCVCEVLLAPAAPMEFIVLLVALSQDGSLELLES